VAGKEDCARLCERDRACGAQLGERRIRDASADVERIADHSASMARRSRPVARLATSLGGVTDPAEEAPSGPSSGGGPSWAGEGLSGGSRFGSFGNLVRQVPRLHRSSDTEAFVESAEDKPSNGDPAEWCLGGEVERDLAGCGVG